MSERRRLLLTVLEAVYVDARKARAVVSIRPKASFESVLGVVPFPMALVELTQVDPIIRTAVRLK